MSASRYTSGCRWCATASSNRGRGEAQGATRPPAITIAVSDTVRWVNRGAAVHAVRGDEPRRLYLPLVLRR
jgi:plastocyanin